MSYRIGFRTSAAGYHDPFGPGNPFGPGSTIYDPGAPAAEGENPDDDDDSDSEDDEDEEVDEEETGGGGGEGQPGGPGRNGGNGGNGKNGGAGKVKPWVFTVPEYPWGPKPGDIPPGTPGGGPSFPGITKEGRPPPGTAGAGVGITLDFSKAADGGEDSSGQRNVPVMKAVVADATKAADAAAAGAASRSVSGFGAMGQEGPKNLLLRAAVGITLGMVFCQIINKGKR